MQATIDADLAEVLEVVAEAVAFVLEDRANAQIEGREPVTLWKLFGATQPRALAIAEMCLEHALTRAGSQGEA